MFGTSPEPEGITNPPIDELLKKIGSKYELAVLASQRARQIVDYRQEMARGDGNVVHYGPLVPSDPDEKPLSIALREIAAGKLEWSVGGHGAASPEDAQEIEHQLAAQAENAESTAAEDSVEGDGLAVTQSVEADDGSSAESLIAGEAANAALDQVEVENTAADIEQTSADAPVEADAETEAADAEGNSEEDAASSAE